MAGGGGEENELSLKYTPTWVVAVVCSVIVLISLLVERFFHFTGKYLKKKNQIPLYEALQKVKEELMLLGFISFLLTVSENWIVEFCVSPNLTKHLLPCKYKEKHKLKLPIAPHYQIFPNGRHLLAKSIDSNYCADQGKIPLLSTKELHHLHMFIFVFAIVHVTLCTLTIFFGGAKIRQWKHWEDSIEKEKFDTAKALNKITNVHQHSFIKDYFRGIEKCSALLGWLHAFVKQFYASVTKSDYIILRLGFIKTHCRGNPNFDFHKYIARALEADFKNVIGISWFLWIFVVIFLLLNIDGWNAYFWISFTPFILMLVVGTKLEHVMIQLAHEVAEKHVAIEGDELVVMPLDDHFWLNRSRMVLYLIHFILFQNAFEIAFFLWALVQYGFDPCIMEKVGYIVPRLVISVFIQALCSYNTLPLYTIDTQMGSSFKKEIFEEHVQAGLDDWAKKAKKKGLRKVANESSHLSSKEGSNKILQGKVSQKPSAMGEEGSTDRIESVPI